MKTEMTKTRFLALLQVLAAAVYFISAPVAAEAAAAPKTTTQYVDENGDGVCDNTGAAMPGSGQGRGARKQDGSETPEGGANRGDNKGGNNNGTGGGNGAGNSGGGNGNGGAGGKRR